MILYIHTKKIRKVKNKQVDDNVIRYAAKKGDTLLIPFLIGPKYSHMMSMNHWLSQKFEEFDLKYSHESIVTHPNVLIWMKKIANQNTFDKNRKTGVVVMPHGSTVPYNEAVEASIQPLKKKYPLEWLDLKILMASEMLKLFLYQEMMLTC